MNLVIVESPAKAKTINKYLGDDYTVLASYGHIRDLPSKNGSVDPDHNFKMEWEVDSFSKKYLKEITDVAKESSKIILATDPDREGEAIAWHVREYLEEKKLLKDKKIERVVFNEITKKAVSNGIDNVPNFRLTNNSGAEVPKETMVIPITKVGILNFKAIPTAPLTSASPATISVIKPPISKTYSIYSLSLVVSLLLSEGVSLTGCLCTAF